MASETFGFIATSHKLIGFTSDYLMKSITEITRWLHIIVATLVVWAQNYIQTAFQKLNARDYYLLGVVFLAIVGMQLADRLATAVIDRFQFIRMLLAGQNDIEGDWVNIVVDSANPEVITSAEYCRIRYRDGQYVLSGDTWALNGNWMQDFSTEGSKYQRREFEYYYKTGVNRVGGFGVILFGPHDSLPTDFICRYVDESTKAPQVTRGQRVSRRLRRVSQEQRRAAALHFANEFDQRGLLDFDTAFSHKRI